jgi:hypothetical protein
MNVEDLLELNLHDSDSELRYLNNKSDAQFEIFQAILCRIIYYNFINDSLHKNYNIIKAFFKQKQQAQEKYLVSIAFTYNLMKIKNKFSYEFLYNQIKQLCSISTDTKICYNDNVFDTPANNSSSFFKVDKTETNTSFLHYFDLESTFWQLDYMLMLKTKSDPLYHEKVNKNKINAICETMDYLIQDVIKTNKLFTNVCTLKNYLNVAKTVYINDKNFKNMNLFNIELMNQSYSLDEIFKMADDNDIIVQPHQSMLHQRQAGFLLEEIEKDLENIYYYGVNRYGSGFYNEIDVTGIDSEEIPLNKHTVTDEDLKIVGINRINSTNKTDKKGDKWQVVTEWITYWNSVRNCLVLMGFKTTEINEVFGLYKNDKECPDFDYFSKNYEISHSQPEGDDLVTKIQTRIDKHKNLYITEMRQQDTSYDKYLKNEYAHILKESITFNDKNERISQNVKIMERNAALKAYEESVNKTNNLLELYKIDLLTLEYFTYNE